MRVDFDENSHTYAIDGEIVPISVTELLRKHGLAPNYDGASATALKRAGERGTAVHVDIAKMINGEVYATAEAREFYLWTTNNHVDGMRAEQVIGYNNDGLMLAGTADVIGNVGDDLFIGDHKTTAAFHEEYVTWQTNIYDYMLRQLNGQKLNSEKVEWSGAKQFYCFQYDKDGSMSVYSLAKIPDGEIERLLECERNGTLYKKGEILLTTGEKHLVGRAEQVMEQLDQIEQYKREIEECWKSVQEQLIEVFKEHGIKRYESERVRITYIASHKSKRLDTKRLQAELPEVAEQYMKESETKETLKITRKGEKR